MYMCTEVVRPLDGHGFGCTSLEQRLQNIRLLLGIMSVPRWAHRIQVLQAAV